MEQYMKKDITKAVEKNIEKFYGNKKAVLTFTDPEDLHQMRVAGRTLLSYFFVLADEQEAKSPGFRKVRQPLKKAMRALGELRDADVLLDEVEQRLPGFTPARRGVIEKWLEQKQAGRESLRLKLAIELPYNIDKKWKTRADEWAASRVPKLADKERFTGKVLELRNERDLVFEAISEYPHPEMSDDDFLNLVHQGRIAVKRLRYALNVEKKFMDIDDGEIEALKTLQDQLGHIQDMRVWISQLEDFYKDRSVVDGITAKWRSEMLKTLKETGIQVQAIEAIHLK